MSLEYIRETYKVPTNKGQRVSYTGDGVARQGTIVGARNAHIMVLLDGDKKPGAYHPTWEMKYLDQETNHD